MFSESVYVFLTSLALPAKFIDGLKNEEATEGTMATLRCELSKAASVTWKKGRKTLQDGDRYSLKQDGAVCRLQIHGLTLADAGEYSCVCGQEKTSATLTVRGKDGWLVFMLFPSLPSVFMCGTVPVVAISPLTDAFGYFSFTQADLPPTGVPLQPPASFPMCI